MLEGKQSMSQQDFKSRIKMFSGQEKVEKEEQIKEIIAVSSRESFESNLKMYSDAAKESFHPRPHTNRILKSTDFKYYNNNFPSIQELNNEEYEKINVQGIINDINDKINTRNNKKKYTSELKNEIIPQVDNEDLWDDLNYDDMNVKKSIQFNEGNLNLKESLKLKGGNLSVNKSLKKSLNFELIGNNGLNKEINNDIDMGISNDNIFERNEFNQRNNSNNLFESSEKYDMVNIGNEYIKGDNNTNETENINQFSENKMENNEKNIENKGSNNEIINDNNKEIQDPNNENKDLQELNNENKDLKETNNENKDLKDNENKDLQDPNNENQNKELQDANNENKNKEEENKEKIDENNIENKEKTDENNTENKEKNDENNTENKEKNDENNNENKEKTDENNTENKEKTDENNTENKEKTDENNNENKEKNDVNNNENKEKTDENEKKEEQDINKPFILSKEAMEEWKKILCQNFENIKSIEENNIQKENELIKNDIKKTREKESSEFPTFQQDLELMLNYYCNYNKIKYKEGLNQIIGAMTLLKYKIDLSLPEIFNLSHGLILKYLTNYYQEETDFSLKSSFGLLHLLLRYHSPRIYNILDKEKIFPDMYAKDWFLTLFSNILDLDLLYYFWNKLIIEDDELFFYFLLISLIITNAEKILSAKIKHLPKIISRLIISTKEEIDFIFSFASDLRKETPYSFRILANRLEIFNFKSKMLENAYEQYKPYSLIAMPIFPTEIFHICYNHLFKCPDELCKNCKNNNQINDSELNKSISSHNVENHIENNLNNNLFKNYKCPHCDKKIDKRMKYILLDLRILEFETFDNEKEKTPFMPQMITIEQNELKSIDFPEKITKRFLKDKGTYHFIFMTSQSDFESLEESLYLDTQSSKNVDTSKKENKKMSLKEKFKKQEFENLKRLLVCLLKAHYPYISFCYGGFTSCHELSFRYNIPLVNHDNKCVYCKSTKKVRSSTIIQNFRKLKFWKKK